MRRVRINAEPESSVWFNSSRIRACIRPPMLAILICLLCGSAATAQRESKNVLVLLSSYGDEDEHFLSVMEPAIRARVAASITFHVAHLINNVDSETEDRLFESQAETFRRQYAATKMDLVIAVSPQALVFTLGFRDKMFPGVPVVFAEVGTREFAGKRWPGVTGLTIPVGVSETIDLAMLLHPDTQTVAILDGPDWYWLGVAHSELLRYRVKVIDFIEPPSRELLHKIEALPPHTVILFELSPTPGSEFGTYDLLREVAARFPTYSPWPTICLNYGCVGGLYGNSTTRYLKAGEIAARVLSGERPEDIPVVNDPGLQVQVDSRALQRWHIPDSALPAGSVILYRQPSFWERDQKYIISAIALIFAQALLIAGLLWQRARKRKAEAVLRESEERFRVMADSTPALIWMCDAQGKITYLNERWLAFTGPKPGAGYGDAWIAYIHPDDVKNVLDELWQALKEQRSFSKEYRLHRSDGSYRWMFDVASPRLNGDRSFAGFIGSAMDITDQKLAQHALESVSGQLIEAQEKERTRIARDLHDDICQRLALLSMELEQAKGVPDASAPARENLDEIRKHCSEIAGDVQSLSHQLHSSKLDYLGVAAAIRGFGKEFSKQHGVSVDFMDMDVPRHLPKDVSLCLFRVAQEALHNAVKYSGVSQFKVELSATVDEVQLQVMDAGAGFDVEEAKGNRGLGLVSMQERVHLVHGKFSIESRPGMGTRIVATVPLVAENGSSPSDAGAKERTGALRRNQISALSES